MVQLTPDWTADACSGSRPQETAISTFDSMESTQTADVTLVLLIANAESPDPNIHL